MHFLVMLWFDIHLQRRLSFAGNVSQFTTLAMFGGLMFNFGKHFIKLLSFPE